MSVPRIAICAYARDERGRFTLPGEYADAVRRAGGAPLVLLPGETRLEPLLEVVDGLVLAGGGDVDPALYGGRRVASTYDVDPDRDALELALVRRALEERWAVLAICRGLQLLDVALGGTLIEHLPDEVGEQVVHRLPPKSPVLHPVEVEPRSALAGLLGATRITPLSWHHQAVRRLGRGLRAVAHAPDGVVEALELEHAPHVVAVQWHPELSAAADPAQQRLFDALCDWARVTRGAADQGVKTGVRPAARTIAATSSTERSSAIANWSVPAAPPAP